MSFPCHDEGIIHQHAKPLYLYPPMLHSQMSDHSATDGLTKTMLLIGTPWWRHVGGVSSIFGYLVDAIIGAVAVPISSPL